MQRYSRQREIILKNLRGRYDHPTAEMVYTAVRDEIPNISLGTVYRNLSSLSSERVILCFTLDGKDHFDANMVPHVHLCCKKCGKIEDRMINIAFPTEITADFSDISNVIIQGTCSECSKQK